MLRLLGFGLVKNPICQKIRRLMSSMLYGVRAIDLLTFLVMPLALASVALLASYVPAPPCDEGGPQGRTALRITAAFHPRQKAGCPPGSLLLLFGRAQALQTLRLTLECRRVGSVRLNSKKVAVEFCCLGILVFPSKDIGEKQGN